MSDRYKEITENYLKFIENHVYEVVSGKKQEFMELNEIASELALSHKHLIGVLKQTKGKLPCHFYDLEIISQAKEMLTNSNKSIAEIARVFTYDPSNFSKFFKKRTGETAGKFRKKHKNS